MGLIKAGMGALGGTLADSMEGVFLLRIYAERSACYKGSEENDRSFF